MPKMPRFLSLIPFKAPRHFTQMLATLAMSLGPFSTGIGKGYSSPALASLQDSNSDNFNVSAQEGSWVASLSLLGALFGCLLGGFMLQIGRKRSLLIVALPFSASWLLTVFAQRVEMMYITSIAGGFLSAITLLTSQVYVSEISHPEIRGLLSTVLKVAGEIGTLVSFILGSFLDWRQLASVAAGSPVVLFFAIWFVPETPSFLLYSGQEEEAFKALKWLRSTTKSEDVASEMETLRSNVLMKHRSSNSFFPRCSSQFPFRQLFVCCGLMFFQKFSGVTVFHHYAVPIIKQVFGRSMNPHGAAILVIILRLIGLVLSGLIIDTAGRLPLLMLSNIFISGSFFGFGLYNWMEESLPPSYPGFGPSLDWIPLTCVLLFTLFSSLGIGPISWLMVGELFPLEYRGFGSAISTSFSYACAFAAVKSYVDIRAFVGLYGAFWIYAAISFVGLFFIFCFVPETKGLQLEECRHASTNTIRNSAESTLKPPTTTTTQPQICPEIKATSVNLDDEEEETDRNSNQEILSHYHVFQPRHFLHENNPPLPSRLYLNLTKPTQHYQRINFPTSTNQRYSLPQEQHHQQAERELLQMTYRPRPFQYYPQPQYQPFRNNTRRSYYGSDTDTLDQMVPQPTYYYNNSRPTTDHLYYPQYFKTVYDYYDHDKNEQPYTRDYAAHYNVIQNRFARESFYTNGTIV